MAIKRHSLSVPLLIGANLIPLFGVLFYGWSSAFVLALFWIENLIIGVFNLLKMLVVTLRGRRFKDLFACGFFVIHYGLFCVVHGAILWEILELGELDTASYFPGVQSGFAELLAEGASVLLSFGQMFGTALMIGVSALALSHTISFIENFVLKGELFTKTVNSLMSAPYARIFIMHAGLILGAFALTKLGSPVWLLVMVVVFKIVADLAQFRRRRKAGLSRQTVNQL